MIEIATFEFFDPENVDTGCIVVRRNESVVGLSISLMKNGDIEVFLDSETVRKLTEALLLSRPPT